ncbi:MAG: HlyD family efflux transporter periplasmic adaptor subunit [Magnetospirillum sp.]|nr:HlyD family efflux transporter periplasmic adaptor subunit [Magnetospirillum sp.]
MRHLAPPERPRPSAVASAPGGSREIGEPEIDTQVTFDGAGGWGDGMAPLGRWRHSPIRRAAAAAGLSAAILGAGAAMVPLDSTITSRGSVVPGHRGRIPDAPGGARVQAVLAADGAAVRAGQALVLLDSARAQADVDAIRARLREALLTQARLEAERDGTDTIALPEELRSSAAGIGAALEGQRHLMASHRQEVGNQAALLNGRITAIRDEIAGYQGENAAHRRRLALLADERAAIRTLLAKGLATRNQLLTLDDTVVGEHAAVIRNQTMIAQALSQIAATQLQLRDLPAARRKQVEDEMAANQTAIDDLRGQLRHAHEALDRTTIRAAESGTVFGLGKLAAGQVVRAGQTILTVMPKDGPVIVEARIPDGPVNVEPGQRATVRLLVAGTGAAPVAGKVVDVRDSDPSGALALVRIEGGPATAGIYPDAPAEVSIVTGTHTMLGVLLRPLEAQLGKWMGGGNGGNVGG